MNSQKIDNFLFNVCCVTFTTALVSTWFGFFLKVLELTTGEWDVSSLRFQIMVDGVTQMALWVLLFAIVYQELRARQRKIKIDGQVEASVSSVNILD